MPRPQQLQHVASPPFPLLISHAACPAACLPVACRERHIPLGSLEEGQFDNPLGEATGAGVIFGNTGGVMEAALRTAYELVSGGWSRWGRGIGGRASWALVMGLAGRSLQWLQV
jgi:hypothetical protein